MPVWLLYAVGGPGKKRERSRRQFLADKDFVKYIITTTPLERQHARAEVPEALRYLLEVEEGPLTLRGRADTALNSFALIFLLLFLFSMWQWIRLQRLSDALLAIDFAQKAKELGITIHVRFPKDFNI
jgi:hypothetical protein